MKRLQVRSRTADRRRSLEPEQRSRHGHSTLSETAVAISSAFGAEGMVLIDMASRVRQNFRLFTLDTEFLFPETYNLMDQVEQRYGITHRTSVSAELARRNKSEIHGPALWQRNPDQCCNLRKVEPLQRKLSELAAWITSIRRDQTAARAGAGKIEWDAKFGLVKINPDRRLEFQASVAIHSRARRAL